MAKMGSHTARFGATIALWARRPATRRRSSGRSDRSHWATYTCGDDGIVAVGEDRNEGWWFSDGYGDYIRHFLVAMAAVPEWAPARREPHAAVDVGRHPRRLSSRTNSHGRRSTPTPPRRCAWRIRHRGCRSPGYASAKSLRSTATASRCGPWPRAAWCSTCAITHRERSPWRSAPTIDAPPAAGDTTGVACPTRVRAGSPSSSKAAPCAASSPRASSTSSSSSASVRSTWPSASPSARRTSSRILAGQHGRTRRCFLDQMSRPEFIDPWRVLRGGHWLDLDWLWEAIEREDPLDRRAAAASGVEYGLVATCARTGEPRYLAPTADDMLDALKASCALPVLYREDDHLRGRAFVDGGLSDPLPVREAYRRGARTLVVVRSRAAGFVKKTHASRTASGRGRCAVSRGSRRRAVDAARAYRDGVNVRRAPPGRLHRDPGGARRGPRHERERRATPRRCERDYALGRALGREAIERFAAATRSPSVSNQRTSAIRAIA